MQIPMIRNSNQAYQSYSIRSGFYIISNINPPMTICEQTFDGLISVVPSEAVAEGVQLQSSGAMLGSTTLVVGLAFSRTLVLS